MIGFQEYLTEGKGKNLHLEHLEDEVLNGGVNGTRSAINFLRSLRDMLAGNAQSSSMITTKWDGAPAISAGYHPNGKFFVSYKSMKKLAFTQGDVDEHYSGGPLHQKIGALLQYLPKVWAGKSILQGDVLWTDDAAKQIKTIDGIKYLTFTPNTITYAVPEDSDLAGKINSAAVGVVFHTTYTPAAGSDNLEDLDVAFGADVLSLIHI